MYANIRYFRQCVDNGTSTIVKRRLGFPRNVVVYKLIRWRGGGGGGGVVKKNLKSILTEFFVCFIRTHFRSCIARYGEYEGVEIRSQWPETANVTAIYIFRSRCRFRRIQRAKQKDRRQFGNPRAHEIEYFFFL